MVITKNTLVLCNVSYDAWLKNKEKQTMKIPMSDEKNAYETMKNKKEKFGTFHKTCFHIHTPESYDYKLLSQWSYNDYISASEQDIFGICIERKVLPEIITLEDITLDNALSCYCSKKELLSYLLLAETIIINEIEVVLVSDHHTVMGVKKLKTAINELCKMKKRKVYPEVLLGIEISCADKNHIVGIFDDTSQNIERINNWLDENLLSVKDGSFKTSIEVLAFVKSIGGIGYIAHIDTSDIFNEKYLSGAYKNKLFSNNVLQIVGISNYAHIEYIKDKINKYRSLAIKVVIDNDAHDIDTISTKTFWIKGSKRNYSMIKEGLSDYDISVSFENEKSARQYIKGIYIQNRESGFLRGNDKNNFCLIFSKALNCLIGGRGTGKSTVLELLEYVLSQKCDNERRLDFICSHGNTWILYDYHGEEFLIEMRMPIKPNSDDNILRCFGQNLSDRYRYRYYFNQDDVRDYAFKHFFKISKVKYINDKWYLETVTNKREMLNHFFDVRYSVNDLVNTASDERINSFLYETLFENKVLSKPEDVIRFKKKSGLIKTLDNIQSVMQKRKEEVDSVIEPFNISQTNILRIIYSQDGTYYEPDFAFWLFGEKYNENKWYKNHNITEGNIIEYLLNLYSELGIFEFLKLVVNKDVKKALSIAKLMEFCTEMNQSMVEQGINSLDSTKVSDILNAVFDKLITDDNIDIISDYLKKYISNIENFSLEFNINNKEGALAAPLYKSVRTLSLGQKVVAMLSFVLGYSEYSKDYRPLIIDQPEDNLDNQYIYKNLVNQLRSIKDKRQVIIATHNATIVTNAKADQVCIMCSDNLHGWIETTGYPGEKRIKKHIINYLEGGIDSFLHKISIYEDALEIHIDKNKN